MTRFFDDGEHHLTRRELLIAGGAGALVLAGCGSSKSAKPSLGASGASAAPTAKPKPGGTLRVGIGGGSSAENFDAALVNGPAATTRDQVFYENLTWMDGTFNVQNALCQELTPNATLDAWTMKLKPEVEFHNGKTLNADDVVFTMNRILNPKVGATASGQYVNLVAATRKLDAQTVRFELKYPYALFPKLLSDVTYVIPVGYDPKNPVSTGPWRFHSFTPGQQAVFTRFENYWGTKALADELILVELPDETARVNALLSGEVDAIDQVPFVQVPELQQKSDISVVVSETGGFNPITMRVDTAPFNDARVRQAIRLLMPRKQAIESALDGQGTPAGDVMGRYSEAFEEGLTREVDVEQAKSLLKQAGRENEAFRLVTAPIGAGIVQACEVLAQSAKVAGVNLTTQQVEPSSYYAKYEQWPFSVDYWVGLPYLITASIAEGPRAEVVNTTHFNDPQYNALYFQASKQADEGKRAELIKEMQKIEYERGGFLIWSFQNTVDAYSTKVAGYDPVDRTAWGLGRCRLDRVGFV